MYRISVNFLFREKICKNDELHSTPTNNKVPMRSIFRRRFAVCSSIAIPRVMGVRSMYKISVYQLAILVQVGHGDDRTPHPTETTTKHHLCITGST